MSLNPFDHARASGLPIPSPSPSRTRARLLPMRSVLDLRGAVEIDTGARVPWNYEPRRVRQYQEMRR